MGDTLNGRKSQYFIGIFGEQKKKKRGNHDRHCRVQRYQKNTLKKKD